MLNQLTISDLHAKLSGSKASVREVVQACLDQIKRVDPQVRAFLSVDEPDALAQADIADKAIAAGLPQPLLGIPIAIKDVLSVKNHSLQCGSRILDKFVSP